MKHNNVQVLWDSVISSFHCNINLFVWIVKIKECVSFIENSTEGLSHIIH
jgi:hypothetical protein